MKSYFFTDTITVFRSTSETRGNGGEIIKTWSSYIDVIGSFQYQTGNRQDNNNIETYVNNISFYSEIVDITEKDYIKYDGKTFDIVDIIKPFNHHMEISLQFRSTN